MAQKRSSILVSAAAPGSAQPQFAQPLSGRPDLARMAAWHPADRAPAQVDVNA